MQDTVAAHAEAFHLAKKPRKLHFAPALGAVHLELEIGGVRQPFTVSPLLATLILPFQEQETATPAALGRAAGVPVEIVLRKCALPHPGVACVFILCVCVWKNCLTSL